MALGSTRYFDLAGGDPLGSAGLRRCGHATRFSRGARFALLALSLLALPNAWAQDAGRDVLTRVGTLVRQLETEEAEEAAHELAELWEELAFESDARTLGPLEAEALLYVSGLFVAGSLPPAEGLPEGSELLEFAREAGASASVGLRGWIDYLYATRLVADGHLEEAVDVLEELLARPPSDNTANALHLIAECLCRLGRWVEALEQLDGLEGELARVRASGFLSSEAESGWIALRARLHGARAQVEQTLGRLDMAARELALEKEDAATSGSTSAQLAHLFNQADFGLLTEDFRGVRELLRQAQGRAFFAETTPSQRAVLELYGAAAEAELVREAGRNDPAIEARFAALLARDELPDGERIVALRFAADLARRRGDEKQMRRCLSARRELLDGRAESDVSLERTLGFVVESKAAFDRGAGEDALHELQARMRRGWEALLERWGETPALPGGIGFLQRGDRREIASELIRVALALDTEGAGARTALQHVFEAEAMGSLARRWSLESVDLERVRAQLLGPRHGVLVFLPSKDRSHLFVFDRELVTHFELPRHDDYQDVLEGALFALRRHPDGLADPLERRRHAQKLDETTRRLSKALLPAELAPFLERWQALTFVGMSLLWDLPPELLRFPDGRFLGQELQVDVVPSLTLAFALAERSGREVAPDAWEMALVATLDPGKAALERWPGLGTRPLRRRELAALVAPFPAERVLQLAGEEVARDALEAGSLRNVPLVHFLLHGVYLDEYERGAALALSGTAETPDVLTCSEVEDLPVSGIVILSACATARGPGRPGDDNLAHLGGAFLFAGARAVVLAGTPVELERTLAFMSTVHERLARGDVLAEALRSARNRAARSKDPLAPYFGAQFSVLGLGQSALDRPRSEPDGR